MKIPTFFAFLSLFFAVSTGLEGRVVVREDVTREVYIPKALHNNIHSFCKDWKNGCITLAHREGKAYDVCSKGYDGANTARVDCLALNGETPAPDYTEKVAKALHLEFVA